MISNILLGSNDIKKAEAFYNELLAIFGARQSINNDNAILWKSEDSSVGIAVCKPQNELVATNGNGSMVGLKADSKEMVIAVYEKAISLGGSCEGAPGERKPGVFAAYFRDLDNNKFGIFYVYS
ncbi:glyoxalase [Endozoicomonas sp. OPT23]|uniref:VOC family protein n=1 Tax=Endozoicomonas sp. OPT23 TaxID=2072845 RepID=UPI00129A4124|nr:VOC family protein [Endozoicomonas sp. OPT23]MRI34896.1 glyoxalase [Endozoicomonas sp. OPT23]